MSIADARLENDEQSPLVRKLSRLPGTPGVYIFKDAAGRILYVGKAKSLRSRVRSYFSNTGATRLAVKFIERHVTDLEVIQTGNEKEALLLENNLIKKLQPRYNIRLRDDKSFLHLRIDRSHPYPAIVPVRRPRRDGAEYFGPYASASAIRRSLRLVRSFLPLRDCSDREFARRSRPCLAHDLQLCAAPCVGLIKRDDYAKLLVEAVAVLEGKAGEIESRLRREMEKASGQMNFERAAVLRDQLAYLEQSTTGQKVEAANLYDLDAVGFHREGPLIEVVVLFFREGKLVAASPHTFESDLPADEALGEVLWQFYVDAGRSLPPEILVPESVYSLRALEQALRERAGRRVTVHRPLRGPKRKLIEMASENARLSLKISADRMRLNALALEHLASHLGLDRIPRDIDCCDISTTSGAQPVGVVVRFRGGEPFKEAYQRFRVRSPDARDDTSMMREVLSRRLRRSEDRCDLPDLLLVDGGRGQLNAACRALRDLGLDIPVAGLAKAPRRGRAVMLRAGEEERLFLPATRDPVVLSPDSSECHLLQRVRDEAHRFAIRYHRKTRNRASLARVLEQIPGLGPVRAGRLLKSFGGLQGVAAASPEELAAIQGIGPRMVAIIHEQLHASRAARQGVRPPPLDK